MIANKRKIIWTWACLVTAILLLFEVSYADDRDCRTKDSGCYLEIKVGGGILCAGNLRFALCTSALCEIDDSTNETKAICDCVVVSGPNWGMTSCEDRIPDGRNLRSNFSPVQAGPPAYLRALVCEDNSKTSKCVLCLDKDCKVDKNDPTRATCICSVKPDCERWETLGGGCDRDECDKAWSAGQLVDKNFKQVLKAFDCLGVPGASYPSCPGECPVE